MARLRHHRAGSCGQVNTSVKALHCRARSADVGETRPDLPVSHLLFVFRSEALAPALIIHRLLRLSMD
jgi:hypothetical protein